MVAFEGFTDADFDAFSEKKWSSNAYNLERLEVKLKLSHLSRSVMEPVQQWLEDHEVKVTEERPSIFNQRQVSELMFFICRDRQSRETLEAILDKSKSIADNIQDPALHHKHIVLGLAVDHKGIQSGLWLHKDAWVDWKNAVQRFQNYGEANRLDGILKSMSSKICYGVGANLDAETQAVCELNGKAFIEGFAEADPWTIIGRRIPRDDAIALADDILDQTVELFQSLLPLYDFIRWSNQNDCHQIKQVIKQRQEKVEKQFRSLDAGDKVRIVKGLASGRRGVIDSIEKKGVVKVRIGMMVMSVKMDELIPS
jgi:hypothetical protein